MHAGNFERYWRVSDRRPCRHTSINANLYQKALALHCDKLQIVKNFKYRFTSKNSLLINRYWDHIDQDDQVRDPILPNDNIYAIRPLQIWSVNSVSVTYQSCDTKL